MAKTQYKFKETTVVQHKPLKNTTDLAQKSPVSTSTLPNDVKKGCYEEKSLQVGKIVLFYIGLFPMTL